jgi:prepilin-type N-terminal cleavage/methylation domain-containing protein/prepilin-type processing-associated H-X9-DG protein
MRLLKYSDVPCRSRGALPPCAGRVSGRPGRAGRLHASTVGFTLIELLVTITIIGVLAAILLPTLAGVQESSRSAKCVSNLRQIGSAMALYANDNNGCYPPLLGANQVNWDSAAINPYLPERPGTRQSILFICPDANYTGDVNSDLSRTYSATECMVGLNSNWSAGNNRSDFVGMAKTLVLFDARQSGSNRYSQEEVTWTDITNSQDLQPNRTTSTYIDFRHRNAFHGLFADGHVDTISRAAAPALITKSMWTGSNR